jgi:ATP-grasp domain, R2K clade family 3
LPGWWADLVSVTPESVWTAGFERAAFDEVRRGLGEGRAVLRDYTKSMKHHWHEAAYIPELGDAEAAWAVASRFRELRDDECAGGFVLRRFEEFTSTEVRTWWVDGECVLTGPHPDTPHGEVGTPDVEAVAPLVAKTGLPFVTVDFAPRADGEWRVVELGDGQVSDRAVTTPPEALVAVLLGR